MHYSIMEVFLLVYYNVICNKNTHDLKLRLFHITSFLGV